MTNSKARVVYRGNYNAYADGGVSYASAIIDASYANANFGSRLAFRSQIEVASSVSVYDSARAFEE